MSVSVPSEADRPENSAVSSAFALLCDELKQQLWRMGWSRLRPIQVEAIRAWKTTDRALLVMAETAGGKTEAAFLPILSSIAREPLGSVRVLYVGPLKALINDQFRRVEELCGYLEMPVHRWHGDVGKSRKDALVDKPGGVLLITPESLESLFINHSTQLRRLFGGLRAIVIDELHAFLGVERGLHLESLLSRLDGYVAEENPHPRRVGLSATIGDPVAAAAFLDVDRPGDVMCVRTQGETKELRLRIHGYVVDPKSHDEASDDGVTAASRRLAEDLVEHTRGRAALVFANRKDEVEGFADLARDIARRESLPDVYLVHHGSLARELREDAEHILKEGKPVTAFCSSTLELGIDIGSVALVGQIGPTWSVASLRQRLGRSGRHDDQPRQLRMYVREDDPRGIVDDFDAIPLDLLQAIALVELLIGNWIEPLRQSSCDLSTLTQQVLSCVIETGGVTADSLHRRLCREGAFRSIDVPLFAGLLRALAKADLIEQAPEGELVLGLRGERIRESRDFYAVFSSEEEFRVIADGKLLGTLPVISLPKVGESLLFAGRRWRIVSVDIENLQVGVVPGRGRKPPRFQGGGGGIHPQIREKMRDILESTAEFAYLDADAQSLLRHARDRGRGFARRMLRSIGDRRVHLVPWTGTRIQATLAAVLRVAELEVEEGWVDLEVRGTIDEVRSALARMDSLAADPLVVAKAFHANTARKYDRFLSNELRLESIVRDHLDFDGARSVATQLLG